MSLASSAVRTTTPRRDRPSITSSYTTLIASVREAGLLRHRPGFYWAVFGGLVLALGGAIAGFVLLQESWFQLLIAAALGIIFTQFAFLAHEASHRQIFADGRRNDRAGRVLGTAFVGMSYQWWMTKHTKHHANPNRVGKDPDIEVDTVSFLESDAARQHGLMALVTRKQAWLFFPLLLLEGLNLHYLSVRSLLRRGPVDGRVLELSTILLRLGLYVGVIFWVLPVGMAFAFLGVQLAVFGFYMGASFAPNHVGMAIIPADSRIDFLRKQVLTSRNISGGLPMTALMGGLNYQVEHHLFPSMSRPALARARHMVIAHCSANGIPYTETNLVVAYRQVLGYLNRVGLAARDPFDCPLVNAYRRR